VSHTHGDIIRKIAFFEEKDAEFLWNIIPLLKPMKVNQNDLLYNQGDHAEESKFDFNPLVFFILSG
jgi:hypothetical protein